MTYDPQHSTVSTGRELLVASLAPDFAGPAATGTMPRARHSDDAARVVDWKGGRVAVNVPS